jgi:molybdopterin converting factor small subunit
MIIKTRHWKVCQNKNKTKGEKSMCKTVRKISVGKVPGKKEDEYVTNEEKVTAGDVLKLAGLYEEDGYEIRVNEKVVPAETELNDGDKVLLVKVDQIIKVRIGKSPGVIQDVQISGRKSIQEAFEAIGVNADEDGWEVRVNSVPGKLDTFLNDGDIVLLIPNVEGN